MVSNKVLYVAAVALFGCVSAQPAKAGLWKATPMDSMVEEMRFGCSDGSDSMACIKFKVISLLDTIFKKENFQLSDSVDVVSNGASARAESGDFVDNIESYIQTHDVTFKLPMAGTKITVSPRNLDNEELNLKIKFADEDTSNEVEERGRKSKLKKIFIPILVFVLLKVMTLVPLAIGMLALKAWNGLQLSFFSFVISVALAIFQLCKKIAADNTHPQIAAHGPWDAAAYRNKRSAETLVPLYAQNMAYNAYQQKNY